MNNFLRYSFLSLMMMLFCGASARDVVILPSDFPATTSANYELNKEGVFVAVTASTVNENQIRVFKGQNIGFAGVTENITKIVFTCTAEGENQYGPGCFEAQDGYTFEGNEGTWVGTSKYALFVAAKAQVRITKIVVTLDGEGSDTPDTPDTPTDKGLFSKFVFTKGTFTDSDNQLAFDFEGLVDTGLSADATIPVTGQFLYTFENNLCTSCKASVTVPEEFAAVAYAAVVADAEKDGYKDVKLEGNTLSATLEKDFIGASKIVIKSTLKIMLNDEEGGQGILESPLSPNQANIFAGTLQNKQVSDVDIYIKGKIAAITYPFDVDHGTATFNISIDGENDFTFLCYAVNYLENKAWVESNTQIKVGDEVIICGKVTNYNGTPETSSKKAYIYSLNGVTKNEAGETPQPQVTTATCAEILAGADGTVYRVTGKCVEIANTVYGNWYLEDATGKVYIYGTLDAEGNTKNFASLGIEVGDEITVEGPRKTYKETVELVDVKVIEIKKGAAEGAQVWDFTKWSDATVANLKADAAASKTSGWSDVEKKADAEAGADPTEASKDNCFWLQMEAAPADGVLTANGVVIEELKGLKFDAEYAAKRSLAIAVNYPSTSLGDYAGPAYLWLGGGGSKQACPCFTIPGVKAGSKITFEMESHKPSDARGIGLYKNSYEEANLIGEQFKPTVKATNSWDITEDCDVVIWNTSGCHIYKIEVTSGASGIQAVKTVKADNGFIYNLAGQRVDANYKGVVIKNGQKMIQK